MKMSFHVMMSMMMQRIQASLNSVMILSFDIPYLCLTTSSYKLLIKKSINIHFHFFYMKQAHLLPRVGLTNIKEVVICRVGPHYVARDPFETEDQGHYHMVIYRTINPISMAPVSMKT